jgi:Mg-chelatase subunit ChlD
MTHPFDLPLALPTDPEQRRLVRWRLVLGGEAQECIGIGLDPATQAMDRALRALYEPGEAGDGGERRGGLNASSPQVARWLGDIRTYFPTSVVRVMQQDALERLGLRRMLLEPELLAAVEPDVHLVATLLSLGRVLPERTKETARLVVRRVVEEIERRLREPLHQAVRGALSRAARTRRPRPAEIDWHRTIRANLRHYQAEQRTIVPETLHGTARRRRALRDVLLLVDQSGSMATSVVYAGVLGAALASLPALSTRVVAFDTAVADLTEALSDPVDLLFGVQLGGGTDIDRALGYAEGLVRRPEDTVLVLVTDLYEGGDREGMLARVAALAGAGVQVIVLLALSDDGAPSFDARNAAALAGMGVPCFACTPDLFPELMAAALERRDVGAWAAERDIVVARATAG